MKQIKTVADVQAVPANEFIPLVNFKEGRCPFCGAYLGYETVGFGRNKCQQYHRCHCMVARAAQKHNDLCRQHTAKSFTPSAKPVTVKADQLFCVISGRILPGVEPVLADDTVGEALRNAGFTEGSSQARLQAYAEKQGWADALKKASEDLLDFVARSGANWKTDISDKVSELCESYGIPKVITL